MPTELVIHSMVRLSALDSLTNFMPQTAELFVPLLQSDDFAVRATAADALGKTKDRKYLPLLMQVYESSSHANEIEGRIAVLDVLADYNTSEVLDVYKKALMDPEYTIRRPRRGGWGGAGEIIHDQMNPLTSPFAV